MIYDVTIMTVVCAMQVPYIMKGAGTIGGESRFLLSTVADLLMDPRYDEDVTVVLEKLDAFGGDVHSAMTDSDGGACCELKRARSDERI